MSPGPARRAQRLAAGLLAALATAALTGGCSGTPCDELPALQAEREQRRAAYLELAASGAPPEVTGEADDALHAFERRVHDMEQSCDSR